MLHDPSLMHPYCFNQAVAEHYGQQKGGHSLTGNEWSRRALGEGAHKNVDFGVDAHRAPDVMKLQTPSIYQHEHESIARNLSFMIATSDLIRSHTTHQTARFHAWL